MIINTITALGLLFCSGGILNFASYNEEIDNISATHLCIISCIIGGIAGIMLILSFI